MARDLPDQHAPGGRDPDVLDAAQAAACLEFPDPQAVIALAAARELPGSKIGRGWLFHRPALHSWRQHRWPGIYRRIAGPDVPDVPDGPALGAAQLAARLGFRDPQTVTDLAAAGELPGRKIGGTWLFAWLAVYRRIAGPDVPDGPVLNAAQLGARLGFRAPQTVTDLAAAGELPGRKIGGTWLFAWLAVYRRIAGPDVPDGPVLNAAQLGARIGVSAQVVRRAASPPGTPGGVPGCKIGKQWCFALEAVLQELDRQPEAAATRSPARH